MIDAVLFVAALLGFVNGALFTLLVTWGPNVNARKKSYKTRKIHRFNKQRRLYTRALH